MRSYQLPPTGGDAEVRSLLNHVKKVPKTSYNVSDNEYLRVYSFFKEKYPVTQIRPELLTGTVSVDDIKSIYPDVNRDSSVGVPWGMLAKTKGEFIDQFPDLLAEAVLDRLKVLVDPSTITQDAATLLQRFAVDPVRLFVKNEFTKVAKIEKGMPRLISSCSLVDEIICRLLFGRQVETEILNHHRIPSKPGFGLSTDEQQQELFDYVQPWIASVRSTDISTWDWSVKKWLIDLVIDVFLEIGDHAEGSFYARAVKAYIHCLMNSLFCSSDGRLFQVLIEGLQKSGGFITAWLNSRMRVALAVMAGARNVAAMGDDCLEDTPGDLLQIYQEYGFLAKEVADCDGLTFSFCSHTFTNGSAVPENSIKTFCKLMNQKYDQVFFSQFSQECRKVPEIGTFTQVYHESHGVASPFSA